ncbi:hypothetical protein ACFY3O_36375 [Streptomyces sp. NPDC001046]|uniref:hypothetical protein n=1 Tax=Streptomyces sp. NPDC001046 TaxID=3364543 RepID=UPI00367D5692
MSTTDPTMGPAFDDLVKLQRTADEAHHRLRQLNDACSRIPVNAWSEDQRAAWHVAWRAWVDCVRSVQEAITVYAVEHGEEIRHVDAQVKRAAGHNGPTV